MGPSPSIERLLEQAKWLRQLAAALVNDAARADDLVQDAWVTALRRPPPGDAAPRRWLARVTRNLAKNTARAEVRRADHEAGARASPAEASPEALAQAAEAQRVLIEAVAALEPALRAVVVLRYFQGLDSAAIGRELGLPGSTVRTRLQAALAKLRVELDRRFGGEREAWSGLFVTLVPRSATTGVATVTAAAGSIASAGAFAGATLVLAAVGATAWLARTEDGASAAAHTVEREPAADERTAVPARLHAPERVAVEPASPATSTAAPAERELAGTVLVDGRVPEWAVELHLEPLDGQWQGAWREVMRNRTASLTVAPDERGAFAFGTFPPDWSGMLRAEHHVFEDGSDSLRLAAPAPGLVVRLRSGPAIRGCLVDARGQPAGAVRVAYEQRKSYDGANPGEFLTSARDARPDGCFRVPVNPSGESVDATLLVEADERGYLCFATPRFAPADGIDLGTLVLEPVRTLDFRVLDAEGAPVTGACARVEGPAWARASEPTDVRGAGVLRFVPERPTALRVSAFRYADHVSVVEAGQSPEITLDRLATLTIELVGPAEARARRGDLVVRSERSLFVWDDVDWGTPAELQHDLGAASAAEKRWGSEDRSSTDAFQAVYRARDDDRYLLVGLRPGVPFEIEVRDADGRVRAVRTAEVARGEWAELEVELRD